MDWPLIGLAVSASWVVLLIAGDIGALLNVSPKGAARLRNVAFFAAVVAAVSLSFVVAAEHRAKPVAREGLTH
ncbi:MAG TPA: hypothetical protein VKG44_00595 [Candidatus Baltobacteraceae bacterium]|nr:hypothetical protein [Candidatus Baltobacteraceae bacterium]